jgi:Flp pilus assembly protein TadG
MKSCTDVRTLSNRKAVLASVFKSNALDGVNGQALLETALMLPLLLGIIEFGRVAYFSILVANAAHAGAHYGARSPASAADNAGMVQAALNEGQNASGLSASAFSLLLLLERIGYSSGGA